MRQTAYIIILCGCLVFSDPLFSIGGQAVDLVKKAQEALTEYGMDPGPIDGIMGPRTQSAIKKYQIKNALLETGLLDTETQKALGILVDGQRVDPMTSDLPRRHRKMDEAETETHTGKRIVPPDDGFSSKGSIAVDVIPVEGKDRVLRLEVNSPAESTSAISSKDVNDDEAHPGYEGHLRLSTIARLVVLAGLGLAALRPMGWILLTGGSLIVVVWMLNWIGGYFNTIAYGVFACAYIIPVLYRLLLKSWDVALIFGLVLGAPVYLISIYAFGLSWWMAGCNGLAVMTLLPAAYRRLFRKGRYRPPYGKLYYRF